MKTRKELVKATVKRYRKADRNKKTLILNEFCATINYNRSYAATLLRTGGKIKRQKFAKTLKNLEVCKRTGRPPIYDKECIRILRLLWKMFDQLCAKRLIPLIRASMPALQNNTPLHITPEKANLLSTMSAATADRLLQTYRKSTQLHGHSYTRRRKGFKESIPVRTFGEWQDCIPGHAQIDTVGHDGGILDSDCSFTLCLTDVYSGWTERYAMQNRAFKWVHMGLDIMKVAVPFPLIHLHPDNGGEFMNHGLVSYCAKSIPTIELSRSRAGKKNDNCYVEQKNFDTIRKLVGYVRYSTQEMLSTLNKLYSVHGLLLNYFYPSQKLISKIREGSKVKKVYDAPQSPAQRILNHPAISQSIKDKILKKRQALDPCTLTLEVDSITDKLWDLVKNDHPELLQKTGS